VEWEAECMTCTSETYISIASKGSGDLEIHMNSRILRNILGTLEGRLLLKVLFKNVCFVILSNKLNVILNR
jgi:hypothetical protein